DERLKRYVRPPGAHQGKDQCSQEGKSQADPIRRATMWVHSSRNSDRRTQGSNLRQGEVNENHSPLDDMNAKIGVNAGEYQTRQERQDKKWQDFHLVVLDVAPANCPAKPNSFCFLECFCEQTDIVIEQL